MPLLLLFGVCAAIAVLAADIVRALWLEETDWKYVIVLVDVAAIALFASLHRRRPRVTEWARSVALIWGLFACASVILIEDVSALGDRYSTAALAAEGVILLALYVVMRLPASKSYLAQPRGEGSEKSHSR